MKEGAKTVGRTPLKNQGWDCKAMAAFIGEEGLGGKVVPQLRRWK